MALFSSSSLFLCLSVLLLLLLLLLHSVSAQCSDRFTCGSLGDIGFPFINTVTDDPDCKSSPFILNCSDNFNPQLQFAEQDKGYPVMNFSENLIVVRDPELEFQLNSNLCASLANFTHIPISPLVQFKDVSPEITFLKCKREQMISQQLEVVLVLQSLRNYAGCNDSYDLYFTADSTASLPPLPATLLDKCSVIRLPVSQLPSPSSNAPALGSAEATASAGNGAASAWAHADARSGQNVNSVNSAMTRLNSLLKAEFSLGWEVLPICSQCQQRGGSCAVDGHGNFQCRSNGHGNARRRKAIVIALSIAVFAFILLMLLIWYCWSRKRNLARTQDAQLFEGYLQNHQSLNLKRYSFSEIKKMTKSFHEKLGQGGYGAVFKGKLSEGRLVAVKVLTESGGNGQEFINEVASISKTSHVNIVTLLGFCCERSKRALVYEFMPNGSLNKFIHLDSPIARSPLNLETLYEIAIGTARGLEYLHCGCNMRIVHFDIKPHNILLDENFKPKISDFGLAKLSTRKHSIISMPVARGTVGYIAPELILRFGGASHKSDVYSYGMMVLEMVGARHNMDTRRDRTSEIYFPHWIYEHLEDEEAFRPHWIVSEEQREIAMKMILVGLWCIQTNPSNRPSIDRALEMIEGPLESILIPPKPFLYSPERSPMYSTAAIDNLESSEMMEGNLQPVVIPSRPSLCSPERSPTDTPIRDNLALVTRENLESGTYCESDSYVSCYVD